MILPFLVLLASTVIVGAPIGQPKCANVSISVPGSGALTCPQTVTLSTSTSGATIFYTLGNSASDPTHTGATATGLTNTYTVPFTSGGTGSSTKHVRAVAYKSGFIDSAITAQEPVCAP